MTTVLGIDPSLTGTGLASDLGVERISSSPTGTEPRPRWLRLSRIVATILEHTWNVDLVVIESPSLGQARQGGTLDRNGLYWLILDRLMVSGIPVVEVSPATVKKYATGKGNATKPDMRMALYQRAGLDIADDNEGDAWWLRAIGLDLCGEPVVAMPAANRTALAKLTLPQAVA